MPYHQSDLRIGVKIFAGQVAIKFMHAASQYQNQTCETETADQSYVGTALTIQLASGFAITVVTIRLVPLLEVWVSWRWAIAFLVPGPLISIWAMWRLKNSPDVVKIRGGKG
jgi:hypothetical protein